MNIAIIDSDNVVTQIYPTDQSLQSWQQFAAGLPSPCTAVEVDDTVEIGDTYEAG